MYISESHFVVRSPDRPAVTGVGLLLRTTGFSNADDKIYATKDYLVSRDALRAVNRKNVFRNAYSRPSISLFDRFDGLSFGGDTTERLYKYYRNKVQVDYDSITSITTLTVRAFDPDDAKRFNEQLLGMAEESVNQMSERGRRDLVEVAQRELDEARQRAQNAAVALAEYRNEQGVLDPEKQATVQMQMISKLQDELIATRTQLVQLRALASSSPLIPSLTTREQFIAHEIDDQLGQVAGGRKSLAATAVQYQRLMLDSQMAEKQVASALSSLGEARSEARRKKAYVERIVQPNRPDYALEPHRSKGIFTTFVLGLIAWGILSMLLAGILEHKD